MMTIHKVGRKLIPVRVIINREEETIWSIPVTKGEHHELETLYDFKAVNYFDRFPFCRANKSIGSFFLWQGIAIYRAEGDKICYVEQLVDLSFDQVLKAVKDQSLHEVFVRQPPRTLFVVNATVREFQLST